VGAVITRFIASRGCTIGDESRQQKAAALALAGSDRSALRGHSPVGLPGCDGLPTILHGLTHGVKMGDFRTIPECKALLTSEMSATVDAVDKCVPGLPTQHPGGNVRRRLQPRPAVACSPGKVNCRPPTEGRRLCRGLPPFARLDKARVAGVLGGVPGLTKRTLTERDLCLS